MITATETEVQNNFGRFLKLVQEGEEIVIIKNGTEVARLVSKDQTVSFLSDSLVGILSSDADEKKARAERMARYEDSLREADLMKASDLKISDYDVIVVGGGFAGSAAALAAARGGAKTLLVERINALGGASVTMLVNPFMRYFTKDPATGETKYLSRGIFEEIVAQLRKENAMIRNRFNPEWVKIILNRKLTEAGVTLLFNSQLIGVEREGDRVASITVANKSGHVTLTASYFIDCTGDADLAAFGGFPYRLGRPEDQLCQPMTLNFLIAGVDQAQFEKGQHDIVRIWNEERAKGYIQNPMDTIMLFSTTIPSIVSLNATRIVRKNPTDCWDVSQADIEAREQVVELWNFLRHHIPGFENCAILSTAVQTGVRESRMIDGEHTLTGEELVACTRFPDRIAAGNYDIDIHNPEGSGTSHYFFPDGQYYTIPYRSLIPKNAQNLLVAGRCISVTHEAQASIRIMPIVCTLGEAAGTAAALALSAQCADSEVKISALQKKLTEQGAFIG